MDSSNEPCPTRFYRASSLGDLLYWVQREIRDQHGCKPTKGYHPGPRVTIWEECGYWHCEYKAAQVKEE